MKKPSRPYTAFRSEVEQACQLTSTSLLVLWGSSEYLLLRAYRKLRQTWQEAGRGALVTRQANEFSNDEDFVRVFSERSLFDPMCLNVILNVEKKKDFHKKLALISSSKAVSGPLVFSIECESILAPLRKEIERLGDVKTLACFDPLAFEYQVLIDDIWSQVGASCELDLGAKALLIDQIGNDAFKLENELHKLASIFAGHRGRLGSADISEHIGVLREDHAFKLDQLLGAGQFAKAQTMLVDLLSRGESPIAVLGIISRHIRHASLVCSGGGAGLPSFIAKNYQRYRGASPAKLSICLGLCQSADMDLKGAGVSVSEDILLGEILRELSLS